MTLASIPPILFVLSLLWFACEAFLGGPVGVSDSACRIAAGILAFFVAFGFAVMIALDRIGGASNM